MPTCLLAGATGLTGQHLWPLLADRYDRVHILLRRPLDDLPTTVETHLIDFEELDQWEAPAPIDHVYCTLGTTQANAGSQEAFFRVDHDYVFGLAQLAQRAQARCFTFISSVGADAESWASHYLRVKGRTEDDVAALGLPQALAIRPALLAGPREEHRPTEVWGERFFRWIDPLLKGRMRRYKPIHVETVARAMLELTLANEEKGFRVIESEALAKWTYPKSRG